MEGVIKAETRKELLSLGNSRLTSLEFAQRTSFDEVMWYIFLYSCWEEKYPLPVSLSCTLEHTSHVHTQYILYIFYLKLTEAQYGPVFLLGVSFQECKCLGPRHSVIYLLIYLCKHLPVPLCLPVAHSSLLSASVSPVGPGTPPLAPLCPLHTQSQTLVCMHIHKAHAHADRGWEYSAGLAAAVLDATLTLLLSALLGPNNPVCSRPCTEVSALRASTICTLSLLDSEHCGGALLEAIESDLIPTLAFCQQRLHSDERNGSSWQTNLLLYVSCGQIEYVQDGLELCFSCQKQVWITAGPATTPPEWSFISSQHCHKVNTSSAIALCFLECLAAHSDVPCPLVLCPTPFFLKCPTFCLDFPFPRTGLSRALQRNHRLVWGQVLFITAVCAGSWRLYRHSALPL